MDVPKDLTDIQRFYKDTTVFLTGATGFIGKLLLEKVLRALPIEKVFILVRKKKDVPAAKRFQDIFLSPAFDLLKRTNPDAIKKVFIIEGDCSLPMLGLSLEDQKTFIDEVSVVLHCAANVRFDDSVKKETLTNVRGTKDLITLAQQVKQLKSFVYVGTGFSNSNRLEIKEEVYPAKITAENLITVCENLDDESLDSMTKTLIGNWPNTYTFTKQVTEDYINRKARDIPICIIRPTAVISTYSEPVAAFVDNIFTLAGFVMLNGLGISRIVYYNRINMDLVPADFVVNICIAAGWQTGESFKKFQSEVPVYHLSSVADNPVTIDQVYDRCDYYARQIPTKQIYLYPLYFRTTCRYNYLILRFFFHTLVAYILDLGLKVKGNKPMFVEAVEKLHKFQESYEYFATHPIYFHMGNTHKILRKMSYKDKNLFNFDITTLSWEDYFSQYSKGLRFYILKDPLSTVPEGVRHYNYLRNLFFCTLVIVTILLYAIGKMFLFRVVPVVFGIALQILRGVLCHYM